MFQFQYDRWHRCRRRASLGTWAQTQAEPIESDSSTTSNSRAIRALALAPRGHTSITHHAQDVSSEPRERVWQYISGLIILIWANNQCYFAPPMFDTKPLADVIVHWP